MSPQHILLVDPNTARRKDAANILMYCGYDVVATAKLDLGADLSAKSAVKILIFSSNLKPRDIQHLTEINPGVNIIVINNDLLEKEWSSVPEQFTPTQLMIAVNQSPKERVGAALRQSGIYDAL